MVVNKKVNNAFELRKSAAVLLISGATVLSACSSKSDSGSSDVEADRYVFATNGTINIPASKGVLANDGSDYVSVSQAPSSALNSDSELTLAPDGGFSYTPAPGIKSDSFTYTASDGGGSMKTATVSIIVAQAVAGCGKLDVEGSQTASFSVLQGVQSTDGVTFSIASQPAKGSISGIDIETGKMTYLYEGGVRGVDSIGVTLTDAYGGSSTVDYQVSLEPIRIMPLGDSITEGVQSDSDTSGNPDLDSPAMPVRVGYRKQLFTLLNNNGYSFDFVGSQTDAGYQSFVDFQHQGHPGYTDAEISGIQDPDGSNSDEFNASTDGVYNWLNQNNADVILLHAGTNNVGTRRTSQYIARILDEVERWEVGTTGSVKVLVAKIVDKQIRPSSGGGDNNNVEEFNTNVQSLVNSRIAQGDNIALVDMFSAVPASLLDSFDKTHLTPAGYNAMAAEWKSSLESSGAIMNCK